MLTVSLMDARLPLCVFGKVLAVQFPTFHHHSMVHKLTYVESNVWPEESKVENRIDHVDGRKYVVDTVDHYSMITQVVCDLPARKESMGRIKGETSYLNNTLTFDQRDGPIDGFSVPPYDATRLVSSALIRRYSTFTKNVHARPGARKVGKGRIQGQWKMITGMLMEGAFVPEWPVVELALCPEWFHQGPQNILVTMAECVLGLIEDFDPNLVRTANELE